jgi:hypothetical protein
LTDRRRRNSGNTTATNTARSRFGFWDIMQQIVVASPPLLSSRVSRRTGLPRFSEPLRDFVAQCLRKEPRDRPTAAQMLQHPFILMHAAPEGTDQNKLLADFLKSLPPKQPVPDYVANAAAASAAATAVASSSSTRNGAATLLVASPTFGATGATTASTLHQSPSPMHAALPPLPTRRFAPSFSPTLRPVGLAAPSRGSGPISLSAAGLSAPAVAEEEVSEIETFPVEPIGSFLPAFESVPIAFDIANHSLAPAIAAAAAAAADSNATTSMHDVVAASFSPSSAASASASVSGPGSGSRRHGDAYSSVPFNPRAPKRKLISVDIGDEGEAGDNGNAYAGTGAAAPDELLTARHGASAGVSAPNSTRSDAGAATAAPCAPTLVHSHSLRVAPLLSSSSSGSNSNHLNPHSSLSASSLKRHRSNPVSEVPSPSFSGLSPLHANMYLHSPSSGIGAAVGGGSSPSPSPTAAAAAAPLSASAAFAANLRAISAARFDSLLATAPCASPRSGGGLQAFALMQQQQMEHQQQQLAPPPHAGAFGSSPFGSASASAAGAPFDMQLCTFSVDSSATPRLHNPEPDSASSPLPSPRAPLAAGGDLSSPPPPSSSSALTTPAHISSAATAATTAAAANGHAVADVAMREESVCGRPGESGSAAAVSALVSPFTPHTGNRLTHFTLLKRNEDGAASVAADSGSVMKGGQQDNAAK